MHSLAAASRPRLSETEPMLFVFEKINVNTVNICLLYRTNSSCKLFLFMYTFIILKMR